MMAASVALLSTLLAPPVSLTTPPESALSLPVSNSATEASSVVPELPPQPKSASAITSVVPDARRMILMVTLLQTEIWRNEASGH
jgi:hypothetical protein